MLIFFCNKYGRKKHYFKLCIKKEKFGQKPFLEETKQIYLLIKKHKKVCKVLKYIEQLFTLVSSVSGRVSISSLASLIGFPVGNTSSAIGLKAWAISAEKSTTKKYC